MGILVAFRMIWVDINRTTTILDMKMVEELMMTATLVVEWVGQIFMLVEEVEEEEVRTINKYD